MLQIKNDREGYWRLDMSFSLDEGNGLFDAGDLQTSRGLWFSTDKQFWRLEQSSDHRATGIQQNDQVQFRFKMTKTNRFKETDLTVRYYVVFGRDRRRDHPEATAASPFQMDGGGAQCILQGEAEFNDGWYESQEYTVAISDASKESFEFVVAIDVQAAGSQRAWQFGYDPEWCVGRTCG